MNEKINDFLTESFKGKNIYVLLQIFWLLEYYGLAFFSTLKVIDAISIFHVNTPRFLWRILERIEGIAGEYSAFLILLPLIFFIIGLCGECFQDLFWIGNYQVIRQYCKIGIHIGIWLKLMLLTYVAYYFFEGWFAPIYSLLLFIINGRIKKVLGKKKI